MKSIRILRVDPDRKTVVAMTIKGKRDATPELRKLTRARRLGARTLMHVDGAPLVVVGGLDVDEAMTGWRLRGTEDHAGVGVLVGQQPDGVLIDVPCTADWIRERVNWLDGEDVGDRDERAAEMVPALNADVERALREAVPVPSGEIWLSAAWKETVGEAMVTLGLGTERSGGQMLTPLGEAVWDKVLSGETV